MLYYLFLFSLRHYISAGALVYWLQMALGSAAMTDYPTPSVFLAPLPAYPVRKVLMVLNYCFLKVLLPIFNFNT